jgi:hypothetical protein
MARRCTVCGHPEREAIDHALVAGEELRGIARTFALSEDAVTRHKNTHLPTHLAKAEEAKEVAQADTLTAELKRVMARVNLLFDACDRWLRDPDNPEQYDIGPRAEDLTVTYLEPVGEDKVVRRKARLSALLPKIERQGFTVELIETKHADPRELILKTSQRLEGQVELLGKLVGKLQEGPTVNLLILPEWLTMRAIIMTALAPFPQAKLAVAAALRRSLELNG